MAKINTGTVILRPIPLNRKPKQVILNGKIYTYVRRDLDGYYVGNTLKSSAVVQWENKVNPEDLYEISVAMGNNGQIVQALVNPDQWQDIINKNLVGTEVEFIMSYTPDGDLEASLTSNNFKEYVYVFTESELTNLLITVMQHTGVTLSSADYLFIRGKLDTSSNKRVKS